MAQKDLVDFDQQVLDLYDKYAHGAIDRRGFLEGAAKFAIGGMTAAGLLEALSPDYALARQVEPGDPAIKTDKITYPSPSGHGKINGLLVRPANAAGKRPGVVVVHENRGLNPYIEDVARRLGKAGFVALAPDGLTPLGGYPGNDDEGRVLQRKLDRAKLLEDFIAGFVHLKWHESTTKKIGVVGFCFGGWVSNAMAVRLPDLACAVPFYGRQPQAADVPRIKAALLLHFGALDARVNAGWPAYEAALKKHGKPYKAHVYPGANHGFHNDTTPRYDKAAAELAWSRTLAFFKTRLDG